ncbi:MAG TPA: LON peptidase substrate-binding domain-containing protein, partial [Bacteroidales bacterium]|nr:LON peptidase substrate-binding domain-containing protein [Bacteroidales bacterium]
MPINTKNRQGKEQEIPFFPLGIVISPGEKIPLRIFEPRYIELITHIEQSGEHFAIPYMHQEEVTSLGSIVKLTNIVDKYPNGEMTILIEGIQFCEIVDYSPKL